MERVMSTHITHGDSKSSSRSCVQQIRIPNGSKKGTCRVQCEHFSMDISYQVEGEDLKLNIKKPLLNYGAEDERSNKENSCVSLTRIKRNKSDEIKSNSRSSSRLRKSKRHSKRSKPSCIIPFSSEKIHSPSSINMITCLIKKPTHKHCETPNSQEHYKRSSRKMGRKPGATDLSAQIEVESTIGKHLKLESHSDTTSGNTSVQHKEFPKIYRNVSVMVKPANENLLLDSGTKKDRKHKNRHHDAQLCAQQIVQVARLLTDDEFRNKVLIEEDAGKRKHHKKRKELYSMASDELVGAIASKTDKKAKKSKFLCVKLGSDGSDDGQFSGPKETQAKIGKIVELVDGYSVQELVLSPKEKRDSMKSGVTSSSKDDTVTSSNIVDTTLRLCLRTKSSDSHRSRSRSHKWRDHNESDATFLKIDSAVEKDVVSCKADLNAEVVTSTIMIENEIQASTELNKTNGALNMETINVDEKNPRPDSLHISKRNGKDLHRCTSGIGVHNGKDLHDSRELQRPLLQKSIKTCVHEYCQSSFTDLEDDETHDVDEITLLGTTNVPESTVLEEIPNPPSDIAGPSSKSTKFEKLSPGIRSLKSKVTGLFPASEMAIQKCSKIMQRKTKPFKRGDRVEELKKKDIARSCPIMPASAPNQNVTVQNVRNEISLQNIQDNEIELLPVLSNNTSRFVLIENSSIYSREEEIRNWSENKDVSNEVLSSLRISDRSILITGTSINTDRLLMVSQSKQNFNSNKSELISINNLDSESNSYSSVSNEGGRNGSTPSPLTNVLVMQCMVPQTPPVAPNTTPIQVKKNITQKDALQSILIEKNNEKVLQCNGFSIIVEEDQENHKCKVVFAPNKPNVLSNYKKHKDAGIQVVTARPSHIELKPVCAFAASPSPLLNLGANPTKWEKLNPGQREASKSAKKSKHKRTTFKPSFESRTNPFEVKRRLCKSPRYIDKVIHDLSVNPVLFPKDETDKSIKFSETPQGKTIPKEGQNVKRASCLITNKRDKESLTDSKSSSESKSESSSESKSSDRSENKSVDKSTMPDFNLDASYEKYSNNQGTMPDNAENKSVDKSTMPDFNLDASYEKDSNNQGTMRNIDSEYYRTLYTEGSDTTTEDKEEVKQDIGIQTTPDTLDKSDENEVQPTVRISEYGDKIKIIEKFPEEVASDETRQRSRRGSTATAQFKGKYDFRSETDNPESLYHYKLPSMDVQNSIRLSVPSVESSEDSIEIAVKPVQAEDLISLQEGSSKSLSVSLRSDALKSRDSEFVPIDCEKFKIKKDILDISPQKFAECFDMGVDNFTETLETKYCDGDTIKLHHNMKIGDFFLALGHTADDCYKLAKDVVLCAFIKTAINEAMVWRTCLTQDQGRLILRLADEVRCFNHVKQYFPRLVEAIVNCRIENDSVLDSFLNLINFMETGELARKSMAVDLTNPDAKASLNSTKYYQIYTMLKKTALRKIDKDLTNKEKSLLRDLAQRSVDSPKLNLDRSKMIARYIGIGKITYKFRLKAAMDYMELQRKPDIDLREFEQYCGIITSNAPATRKRFLPGVY